MCQSIANGGHRCKGTVAGKALYKLYRERKQQPERVDEISHVIRNVKEARSIYGDFVSPMDMPLDAGVATALEAVRKFGNPLIVGGAVRDVSFGAPSKDTDIEVYGTTLEDLTLKLRLQGFHVDEVGKEFGVLKVSKKGVVSDLDIAVPRSENQTGRGHRDFAVKTDENMTVEDAASRRDFTINAMSYDPRLGVLIDPYNGSKDAEKGLLRAVSDKFGEDPLRVLRGFQFAARFGMIFDTDTALTCRNLRPQYDQLSTERVQEEWTKFFTKGTNMLRGVRTLQDANWDDTLPGLREALANNDVVDSLGKLPDARKEDRTVLGAAAIMRGMPDSADRDIFRKSTLIGKDAQKIAADLAYTDPVQLDTVYLQKVYAKEKASRGFTWERYRAYAEMVGDAKGVKVAKDAIAAGVGASPEPGWIQGRDIIALTSRKPGPWVGKLVDEALDRQYRGLFEDKEDALEWVQSTAEFRG